MPTERMTAAMKCERLNTRVLVLLVCTILLVGSSVTVLHAQTGTATLSGTVMDPSGKVVPDAAVSITNVDTGIARATKTNGDGIYVLAALQPGHYRVIVTKPGFKQVALTDVILNTQDSISRNFNLEVGAVSETVSVSANNDSMQTDSPAVSMTVTREFVENMPLNGRSFQDLIQLAPGTVSGTDRSGYYSINGQRTDSNNYTVDGVSANLGGYNNNSGGGGGEGSGLAGSSPLQTALGTTQSLASIDSLQEFKIQTSGYTAEFGRNPGGQVAFTTRSGTNDIHGTLFDYLRNTDFDANDYFNDYYGYPKTAERQNDFGGTFGGPLTVPKLYDGKDKTFFFFSYEGLRLFLPQFQSAYETTQAFREWASPYSRPYLNALPLPNQNAPGNQDGCTIPDPATGQPTACDALFTYGYSTPNNLDNISARLDQNFGERIHAFVRYADTPSSGTQGSYNPSAYTINVHTWTVGVTANVTSTLVDDFRFNYTHDDEAYLTSQKSVGGSAPLPRNLLIPTTQDSPFASGEYFAYVPGTSVIAVSSYGGSGTLQHQYQLVDSLQWTRGNHGVTFGVDWRRLTPTISETPYAATVSVDSLPDIQNGYASTLEVSASAPGQPIFDNLSLYAQDHYRINPRLSVDYGLRWEFDPPPGPANGHYPATLTSSNLATAQLAPPGTAPYKTTYHHFAPRLGFAWNAIPSNNHSLTVRGGVGIFYDTGQTSIGQAYASAYPFSAVAPTQMEVPLPLSTAALAPPSLNVPLTPPYPYLNEVTSPSLTLPYVVQWNLSVDEALNSKDTLTVSYVGNEGKKLLFTGFYQGGPGTPISPDFANGIDFSYNGSSSNYNALQVQNRGRVTNGLDLLASFTYAHARDNASNDYSQFAPQWGNSDNDIRESFSIALTYQVPTAGSSRWLRALTGGWLVANRFTAQSGYPVNIIESTYVPLPNGTFGEYAPDLVPGVPIYLHGSAADVGGQPVPGSWRLNSAAFTPVPTDPTTGLPVRQGTLGRNYVRGPGFYALNTAVQRTFPIRDQLHLVFRVEAFNILNHPNLGNPDAQLSDPTFGQLLSTTSIGSSNTLYSMGGPRSLQLGLKLQF